MSEGLTHKYDVYDHETGEPITDFVFVLKPSTDSIARVALRNYAEVANSQGKHQLYLDLMAVLTPLMTPPTPPHEHPEPEPGEPAEDNPVETPTVNETGICATCRGNIICIEVTSGECTWTHVGVAGMTHPAVPVENDEYYFGEDPGDLPEEETP